MKSDFICVLRHLLILKLLTRKDFERPHYSGLLNKNRELVR